MSNIKREEEVINYYCVEFEDIVSCMKSLVADLELKVVKPIHGSELSRLYLDKEKRVALRYVDRRNSKGNDVLSYYNEQTQAFCRMNRIRLFDFSSLADLEAVALDLEPCKRSSASRSNGVDTAACMFS